MSEAKRSALAEHDDLVDKLRALHAWEELSGPHTTGLGHLQTWVSAYHLGVLSANEEDPGPRGRIAD